MKKLSLYITVVLIISGSAVAYAQSSLRGKWRGMEGNLTSVDLTVDKNAGQATGTAVFYLIKKNLGDSKPYVAGQAAGPMENLNYQPENVSFDMHRSDGSLVSFRIEMTDANHAKLFRTNNQATETPGLDLTRVQ